MFKLPKIFFISICLLMALFLLVGCDPEEAVDEPVDDPVDEPIDDPVDVPDNNVIPIGYVAPFTGPAAEFGTNGWRGVEIAVDVDKLSDLALVKKVLS